MLFAGQEVRIGNNCARGLEYAAKGHTQDREHTQFFPIWTDLGQQMTCLFFSMGLL